MNTEQVIDFIDETPASNLPEIFATIVTRIIAELAHDRDLIANCKNACDEIALGELLAQLESDE